MLVLTPDVWVFVFELTARVPAEMAVLSEDDADCTSDKVAREPDVRPAPVRVRVAADHTSVANVPKVERLREP